jgi:hypothetical protein
MDWTHDVFLQAGVCKRCEAHDTLIRMPDADPALLIKRTSSNPPGGLSKEEAEATLRGSWHFIPDLCDQCVREKQ